MRGITAVLPDLLLEEERERTELLEDCVPVDERLVVELLRLRSCGL